MNKRILDGAGLWKSDKLARVQPEWMRAEYANWIPLALANGVFEADTRRIWATVYSYNRPDIAIQDAEEIKRELFRVGLLFLWRDEPTGKTWAFFTGIDKPGRLPPPSRVDRKHEPVGPIPPAKALRCYIETTLAKPLDPAMASQWLADGYLGFGFGFGIGFGSGKGSRASHAPVSEPAAPGVCEQIMGFWNANRRSLPEVLKLTHKRKTKILARLKEDRNFVDTFRQAVLKAAETPFCCGAGERNWKASLDWLIANDTNCVAVLEGKYDGKGNGNGNRADNLRGIASSLGLAPRTLN